MSHDTLSGAIIAARLQPAVTVKVYDELDSTNNEGKRLAAAGNRTDTLLIADRQTAGRGRLGRSFWSPAGSGLYMTLLLHGIKAVSDALLLTTMAATAVVEAVETLTPLRPQIKWVNDVYLGSRKACGILAEALTNPTTGNLTGVMIGIGINVREEAYPPEIAAIATHLELGAVTRNELAAEIVNRLYAYIGELPKRPFLASYRAHSLVLGKPVVLLQGDKKSTATAVDIDDGGGLIVRYADGKTESLHSGEISIRLKE